MNVEKNLVPEGKVVLSEADAAAMIRDAGLDDEKLEWLREKAIAVNGLNYAFSLRAVCGTGTAFGSIVKAELRFYLGPGPNDRRYLREYLVITYHGGAYTARIASANSNGANLREIAKLVDGGYYDELEAFERADAKYPELRFLPLSGRPFVCETITEKGEQE